MNNDELDTFMERHGDVSYIHAVCKHGTYHLATGGRVIKSYIISVDVHAAEYAVIMYVTYSVVGSHNMELVRDIIENPNTALLNMKNENEIVAMLARFRIKAFSAKGKFEIVI